MGKISLNKLVMDVIVLLPITVLFQGFIPIINKVVFFIVIVGLLYIVLKNPHSLMETVVLLAFGLVYILSFVFTGAVADNTNEYFYLLFFIIFSSYTIIRYDYIKSYLMTHIAYLRKIVIVWDICVIISMFFKSSYKDGFFFSFTGSVFRSATASIFILSLVLILITDRKRDIVLAIVPLYCVFSGGSRTYLAVGLALTMAAYYMAAPSRKFFWLSLIPIIMIVAIIIFNSSIMDKINSSLTVGENEFYQDQLIKFTSGRSLFWVADMRAFFNGSILHQLFGFGFNFVYDVNEVAIQNRIWAHNDFINILLNYGYIGLFCYICMFKLMYTNCIAKLNLPKLMRFILVFVWAFNAFFNMFYTYSCACASYPFLLFGVSMFWENRIDKEKKGWERKLE